MRGRGPGTWGFVFVGALGDSCTTAAALTLSLYLDRIAHVDAEVIGRLLAVPTATYIICSIPMGHWGDRFGVRRFTIIGAALIAASTGALCMVHRPADAIAPLIAKGIGAAMFWPGLSAWLSRGADSRELPRRMAAFNLGWSGGSVFGAGAAGLLYDGIGPNLAWAAYGLIMGLGFLVTCVLPRPRPALPPEHRAADRPPSPLWRRRQAWLASFAAFFVINAVRSLFPVYARQCLSLSPTTTTAWLALICLVQTLAIVYLGLLRPGDTDGRWVEPVQWAAVVGLLMILTGRAPLVLPGLLVLGLYTAVSYTASMFHSLHGRDDAARQTGIIEAVVGLGGVLGPWLGGTLARHFGPSAPYAFGALLTLAVIAVTRVEHAQRRDALAERLQ